MKKTAIIITIFLLGCVAFLASYLTSTVNILEPGAPGFTPGEGRRRRGKTRPGTDFK